MVKSSGLLEAIVYHKRHSPIVYDFSHKLFYLILNLNDIKSSLKTRLFSINRFNIFSLFWKDYGFQKFDDPKSYVFKAFADFNLNSQVIHQISLVTLPKVLGYSFNPVSFWLCFNKDNLLSVVLAEVNNTFGERHGYLCFNENLAPIQNTDLVTRPKVFHVSPFCNVKGDYQFRFDISSNKISINIEYYENGKKLITTLIKGRKIEFIDKNLVKCFFVYSFMTFKVIFLIHYHAFHLWMKKVPYIKKPSKPKIDIT